MNTETLTMTQSTPGADWATYYSDLEKKGNVPDAACKKIDQNIFPTNLPSPPDTLAKKIPLVSMGG